MEVTINSKTLIKVYSDIAHKLSSHNDSIALNKLETIAASVDVVPLVKSLYAANAIEIRLKWYDDSQIWHYCI